MASRAFQASEAFASLNESAWLKTGFRGQLAAGIGAVATALVERLLAASPSLDGVASSSGHQGEAFVTAGAAALAALPQIFGEVH